MNDIWLYLSLFVFVPIGISLIVTLFLFVGSPFKFPYKEITFDVSGTKKPKIEDYIDRVLISNKMDAIDFSMLQMLDWKKKSLRKINKSVYKKRRKKQFEASLDWDHAFFLFLLVTERDIDKSIMSNILMLWLRKWRAILVHTSI